MAEERDTYEATRARLEEIATSVRKKDVTLEKSIELLEEGVRLANLCTEQVDQVELTAPAEETPADGPAADLDAASSALERGPEVIGSAADEAPAEPPAPEDAGDPLAEAFADVGENTEREACEGQTEAFGD
jgi:exodeoxyribonuclease VII small subunit